MGLQAYCGSCGKDLGSFRSSDVVPDLCLRCRRMPGPIGMTVAVAIIVAVLTSPVWVGIILFIQHR